MISRDLRSLSAANGSGSRRLSSARHPAGGGGLFKRLAGDGEQLKERAGGIADYQLC